MPHWRTPIRLLDPQATPLLAEASLPHDSLFFSGHFPGKPVVPGIALLAMVERVVQLEGQLPGRTPRRVAGFSRVRFRRAVESGGTFQISLSPLARDPGAGFLFKVRFEGADTCEGQVLAPTQEEP